MEARWAPHLEALALTGFVVPEEPYWTLFDLLALAPALLPVPEHVVRAVHCVVALALARLLVPD